MSSQAVTTTAQPPTQHDIVAHAALAVSHANGAKGTREFDLGGVGDNLILGNTAGPF